MLGWKKPIKYIYIYFITVWLLKLDEKIYSGQVCLFINISLDMFSKAHPHRIYMKAHRFFSKGFITFWELEKHKRNFCENYEIKDQQRNNSNNFQLYMVVETTLSYVESFFLTLQIYQQPQTVSEWSITMPLAYSHWYTAYAGTPELKS